MVTSSLTDSVIKKTLTDRLFFDSYQYVLSFKLVSICCLRSTLRIIDGQDADGEIIEAFGNQQRYINQGGSWRTKREQMGKLEDLLDFANKLRPHQNAVHLMVSGDWGYVYTSDINIITSLQQLSYIHHLTVREAVISRPRDSIVLTDSMYNTRSYFRDRWLNEKEKNTIRNFLKNQTEIRLCPSLDKLVNPVTTVHTSRYRTDGFRLQRHHFFDHNHDSVPFMLELVSPGLIRKTARILTK